jgi:hypothetical protein
MNTVNIPKRESTPSPPPGYPKIEMKPEPRDYKRKETRADEELKEKLRE